MERPDKECSTLLLTRENMQRNLSTFAQFLCKVFSVLEILQYQQPCKLLHNPSAIHTQIRE